MAECHPSKVDVASSNLVSRSFLFSSWACSSMAEQLPHTRVCVAGEILRMSVVKFGET